MAIRNNAAVNIRMHVFVGTFVFISFEEKPRNKVLIF